MSNILTGISFAANHFVTLAELLTIVFLFSQIVKKKLNFDV